ncbi:MAG: S-layer homology domain-containing protein [Leucobacter sp.]
MTAQKSLRKRFSSLLAAGAAALVAISGAALAPTAAFAADAPTITLSKSVLNPDGDVITVTGTGFDTSAKGLASYYGCENPTTASKGFYVQLGWIKDTWRPSTGGVNNTDRKGGLSTWFADDTNCVAPARWTVAEDGTASFKTSFTVTKAALGELPEGARYAVFTSGAGGGTQPANEVSADLTFSNADPAPSVTASVSSAVRGTLGVEFDLANITSDTGAYISVVEAGKAGELSMDDLGVASDWITPSKFTDGAATSTLSISSSKLDRSKSYEIVSWKAHSFPDTGDVYAYAVPLTVTDAQWDAVFAAEPQEDFFTDVKQGDKFYTQIQWMGVEGISTGVKQQDGTYQYQPKNSVTREAMAAFLYRQYAPDGYQAPAKSKFTDVKQGDKFYTEISWMADAGISTGVKQKNGTLKYEPKSQVSREAMAAFMYRADESAKPAAPATSPFADVKPSDKFFKQIAWMSQAGISTGTKQSSGKPVYAPKSDVSREAMAAFMYRAAHS